ncbi:hypothetical protein HDU97_000984 [Phlyctochytrium planicorne]|nr:hypothetical protein HDU97_000984 [Phlyctochytrium planicorne]
MEEQQKNQIFDEHGEEKGERKITAASHIMGEAFGSSLALKSEGGGGAFSVEALESVENRDGRKLLLEWSRRRDRDLDSRELERLFGNKSWNLKGIKNLKRPILITFPQ